jgi:FlaA1/EpsC-like NDP-sugar epimerase/lipopolysaccharide/colanic/teichoic acid biosynthesis glycosyltransferase
MKAKRLFDVIFSILGLIFLFPLFLVIALLVRWDSAGSILFSQRRVGRDFKPFDVYKFRTMVADAPEKGGLLTSSHDPRITRVGRILRRAKVDELPQLWNVLKGDMSLVGPRPEVEKYVEMFKGDYQEILEIRPGITDIASLTYSDEETILRDKPDPEKYYIHVLLPEKIRMAKEYVRHASLGYDLKLISLTLLKIIYPHDRVLDFITVLTPFRRPIVIGIHILIFALASYLAFFIRFDGKIPNSEFAAFLRYLPILVAIRIIFLFTFALDQGLWRFVSVKDVLNISGATTLGTLVFFFIVRTVFGDEGYPRSVYVMDWFLNVFMLGSIRLFRRLHEKRHGRKMFKKRVLVIGAGSAAEMLLREVDSSPYYPYEVIGLIDDNPLKKGLMIRNVKILGDRKALSEIVDEEKPDEFLIAIPSASRSEFSVILEELRQYALPIKTMPSLWSILSGRGSFNTLRAVEPEDILFRAPALNGSVDLTDLIRGKTIMVTGAGGSIGSELCRQIAGFGPERLVLYERHEENLYKIDKALRGIFTNPPSIITPVIGDILDEVKVDEMMRTYRPQLVFHAAAYKHVPLMENNPCEAFRTNVEGTRVVAEKASQYGVQRFVLISTDKAVAPVNVMGMTKKIAEEIIQHLAHGGREGGTRFITVRFGNVLESSGSVVPLFKEQIARGGPVTVTHPEITRYFMTIGEAVRLVLQSAALGRGGDVLVLDMGNPVKILELAKRMIDLYGYKPGIDVDIIFTGLRPGEKLDEELFNPYESVTKTSHTKINLADSNGSFRTNVLELLDGMEQMGFPREDGSMKEMLGQLIQSFSAPMLPRRQAGGPI